eukprot:4107150-Ditylum_brightwellii.AAC.1
MGALDDSMMLLLLCAGDDEDVDVEGGIRMAKKRAKVSGSAELLKFVAQITSTTDPDHLAGTHTKTTYKGTFAIW